MSSKRRCKITTNYACTQIFKVGISGLYLAHFQHLKQNNWWEFKIMIANCPFSVPFLSTNHVSFCHLFATFLQLYFSVYRRYWVHMEGFPLSDFSENL